MEAILSVNQLSISERRLRTEIVSDLSFAIYPNEVLALTGESGSGKTVTALSTLGLLPEGLYASKGSIHVEGVDIVTAPRDHLRAIRGAKIAWVPQDPFGSLNPAMSIGMQLSDAIRLSHNLSSDLLTAKVHALLRDVQLADVVRISSAYPHQLSGGQAQRVCIARAIARDPLVLIADEPTTALDLSTQKEIIELLATLRRDRGMSMLFVTHDFGAMNAIANKIGVMYCGQLVEMASKANFFSGPRHPYAAVLVSAAPSLTGELVEAVGGTVPAVSDYPPGCRFAARCSHATDQCYSTVPVMAVVSQDHAVACHHWRTWRREPA